MATIGSTAQAWQGAAVFAEPIEVEAARDLVLERARPLGDELVPLAAALGRMLARDAIAAEAVPAFDNSAMDGYAIRAADAVGADVEAPALLRVVGESRAGHPAPAGLGGGEAIAISTGAVCPVGADAVVPVELTAARNGSVEVRAVVARGANIRRAGEDIAAAERLLAAGAALGPAELGVLAAAGRPEVRCSLRPRLAVLVTGDELIGPAEPLRPGAVRDSNAYTVPALAARAGAEVVSVEQVGDDAGATESALAAALGADALVVCGGVSVGAHDHVRPALARLGVEQVFWRLALRPGKPTWFGRHPGGALVFGLPGNPVSAMVTFLLLVRPALLAMQGRDPSPRRLAARFGTDYAKRPGRAEAVRCRLEDGADGLLALPTKEQGSHVLTSMLGADCLAWLPTESAGVRAGERVEAELLPEGLA
jgi:molybdopterin molybdotransferase